jgi:hypothetical protein
MILIAHGQAVQVIPQRQREVTQGRIVQRSTLVQILFDISIQTQGQLLATVW